MRCITFVKLFLSTNYTGFSYEWGGMLQSDAKLHTVEESAAPMVY